MRSLWLEEALAGEDGDAPPLEGRVRADVCVVGGGFTGLWTALRLKELEPSLEVVLLEGDVCGGGASGRNGGFVLSWWAKFGALEAACGAEEALRLARASADAVAAIGAFATEHGIAAEYRADGWLWTATSAAQVGAWDETVALVERRGESPFVRLAPEEVVARSGSPVHVAGVLEPAAATVHPGRLARGLRRVALERGVRLHEGSRVRELRRSRPPLVRTDRGEVVAERVVLALNAWSAGVRELRRAVVVIASDVIATAPAPERLADIGWTTGTCIDDSRMLVNYYRTTGDGRVVFGKGGGALAYGGRIGRGYGGPSPRVGLLARCFHEIYPALADVPIATSWLGPIDRAPHGLPFFTRLGGRDDLLAGAGFSGNGVGPSYLGGRMLASLALGVDDEWSRAGLVGAPFGSLPPEPVRFLGGLLVKRAVARKERAEDAGRRPGRVAVRLASLAPAGLVPLNDGQ